MYWETYAYIKEGKVINLGVYEPNGSYTNANTVCHNLFGYDTFAVNVTDYPVAIGDEYRDGYFYRNGEVIEKFYTIDDQILELKKALVELAALRIGD